MLDFCIGSLMTLGIHTSFFQQGVSPLGELLISNFVSLLGGVLSALIIARLQERFRPPDSDPK